MKEFVETKTGASYDGGVNTFFNVEAMQNEHVVICGLCGAVERPLGPHKSECPNCDDYIY